MANITIINTKPESIIEYTQLENGPDFSYNEKFGAIIIKAGESKWLFRKCKAIKLNKVYYDDNRYNLLFMSANNKKFDTPVKLMICGYENIILYNTGIIPKHIKKGEVLGYAILIPKIESHILELK